MWGLLVSRIAGFCGFVDFFGPLWELHVDCTCLSV